MEESTHWLELVAVISYNYVDNDHHTNLLVSEPLRATNVSSANCSVNVIYNTLKLLIDCVPLTRLLAINAMM